MSTAKLVTFTGNRKAVVGLTWHAIIGQSGDKELAELCTKHGSQFGVVLKSAEASIAGLSDAAISGPSAAAWLASASKGESIVLLEPLPDGQIWLCAVRNSMPQPGFDIVIDPDPAVAAEHLNKLGAIAKFKVVSRYFAEVDEDNDFATLIEGVKPQFVHQLTGVSAVVKYAVAALVLLIGGGIGGYYFYEDAQRAAAAKNLEVLRLANDAATQREAEARRQAALAAAEATVTTRVTSAPSPTGLIGGWLSAFDQIPTSVTGWSMAKVDCIATECKITWARKEAGTSAEFIARAANSGWRILSQDMNSFVTVVSAESQPRSGRAQDVPSSEQAMPQLLTAMQRLSLIGIQGQLNQAAPVGAEAASAAAPGQKPDPTAAPPSPWKIGSLTLTGRSLFEPREVVNFLEYGHVSISSLNINFDNQSWTMEGSYAVQ